MEGTESAPFFAKKAEGIIAHLAGNASPEAARIVAQAEELIVVFRQWSTSVPANEERTRVVQKLFLLNREAIALVPLPASPEF